MFGLDEGAELTFISMYIHTIFILGGFSSVLKVPILGSGNI